MVPIGDDSIQVFYRTPDGQTKERLLGRGDEENINLLASDPTAALKITVEINAEFSEGASDQIKRAVSENATSLEFGTKTWE